MPARHWECAEPFVDLADRYFGWRPFRRARIAFRRALLLLIQRVLAVLYYPVTLAGALFQARAIKNGDQPATVVN